MNVVFSKEEQYLLKLLNSALTGQACREENINDVDVKLLVSTAKKHAVLPFLYDILQENKLFESEWEYIEKDTVQTVTQNYRLLMLTKYLMSLLEENNIQGIVLKGVSTGGLYPIPEYRKSGDVDILIPPETDPKRLISILKDVGFVEKEEQHASHHIEFRTADGIVVEIHTTLTEQFAYKRINEAMRKQVKDCFIERKQEKIMSVDLPVLSLPYHAYELLLHMLHHFLYTGFGLKLLCDWVVLWKVLWNDAEKQVFRKLTQESGTERFAEIITEVCVRFLGLNRDSFAWYYNNSEIPAEEFLREIFEAEEFGRSDKNRMVMMSGTGISAYMKEFHHQMHINFPKAGKIFLLWPILWVITLIKFLYNNKKVRGVSSKEVLKEAKRRSGLMEKMKLFE